MAAVHAVCIGIQPATHLMAVSPGNPDDLCSQLNPNPLRVLVGARVCSLPAREARLGIVHGIDDQFGPALAKEVVCYT